MIVYVCMRWKLLYHFKWEYNKYKDSSARFRLQIAILYIFITVKNT